MERTSLHSSQGVVFISICKQIITDWHRQVECKHWAKCSPTKLAFFVCLFPPTDSLLIATSRRLNAWEHRYHHYLKKLPKPMNYFNTALATHNAAFEFSLWHTIMDYSAVSEDSTLFRRFFSTSRGLTLMFRCLQHWTKKKDFLFRREVKGIISAVHSPSAKCYSISEIPEVVQIPWRRQSSCHDVYPENPQDIINVWPIREKAITKAKGLRKATLQFECSIKDFLQCTKTDAMTARSFRDYSLKKRQLRIFLSKNKRVLLSRCTIKRLNFVQMRYVLHHLTFPLYFKNLLRSAV